MTASIRHPFFLGTANETSGPKVNWIHFWPQKSIGGRSAQTRQQCKLARLQVNQYNTQSNLFMVGRYARRPTKEPDRKSCLVSWELIRKVPLCPPTPSQEITWEGKPASERKKLARVNGWRRGYKRRNFLQVLCVRSSVWWFKIESRNEVKW